MKMRQSLINTTGVCAHRLTWNLDPSMPYQGGVTRAIGTGIHAAHESYYNHRKETGEVENLDLIPNWIRSAVEAFDHEIEKTGDSFGWQLQPKNTRQNQIILDYEGAVALLTKAVTYYYENACYWPAEYEVVAAEWTFDHPWDEHPNWVLHGTLDLLLRHWHNRDQLTLVDHKNVLNKPYVNKFDANKSAQAAFYLHAVDTVTPDSTSLRFVYDALAMDVDKFLNATNKKGEPDPVVPFWRMEAPRTQEQIDVTLAKASMVADLIDSGGPYLPNPESNLCSAAYCDYWDRCKFGATLRNNPREDKK